MNTNVDVVITEAVIKRIKQVMEDKELTPYRVSKNANMNPRTLNSILSGVNKDIKISTLHNVCKGLGLTIKAFFDDEIFH